MGLCETLDEKFLVEFVLGISIGFGITFCILLFAMLIANEDGYFDSKPIPNPKKIN